MGWYDNIQVQAPSTQGYAQALAASNQVGDAIKDVGKQYGQWASGKELKSIMANKPQANVDPSAHIAELTGYLGYASPEQAKAVSQYQDSLNTGYARDIQKTQFKDTEERQKQEFLKKMDLQVEEFKANTSYRKSSLGLQQQQVQAAKEKAQFDRMIQKAELESKGYDISKDGIKYNPSSPNAILRMDEKYRDYKLDSKKFMESAHARDLIYTRDSEVLDSISKAEMILKQPASSANMIKDKAALIGMVEGGDYKAIKNFLNTIGQSNVDATAPVSNGIPSTVPTYGGNTEGLWATIKKKFDNGYDSSNPAINRFIK